MKHTLIYAYICDWCLHNNTIDSHYRHSRCLLNLVFTEKYGKWKNKRDGSGRGNIHEGDVLFSTQKMATDTVKGGVETRPICSSILIRPHESLKAVQLFILTQKPQFHHPSQGTKIEFAGFILQKFWEFEVLIYLGQIISKPQTFL